MKHPKCSQLAIYKDLPKLAPHINSCGGNLCLPCVGGTCAGGLTRASNRLHATCHRNFIHFAANGWAQKPETEMVKKSRYLSLIFCCALGILVQKYPKEIVKWSPTKKNGLMIILLVVQSFLDIILCFSNPSRVGTIQNEKCNLHLIIKFKDFRLGFLSSEILHLEPPEKPSTSVSCKGFLWVIPTHSYHFHIMISSSNWTNKIWHMFFL